jgi:hypothetical protein
MEKNTEVRYRYLFIFILLPLVSESCFRIRIHNPGRKIKEKYWRVVCSGYCGEEAAEAASTPNMKISATPAASVIVEVSCFIL